MLRGVICVDCRDKFDRDYEELSTERQLNEDGASDGESDSEQSSYAGAMMGMAGLSADPSRRH